MEALCNMEALYHLSLKVEDAPSARFIVLPETHGRLGEKLRCRGLKTQDKNMDSIPNFIDMFPSYSYSLLCLSCFAYRDVQEDHVGETWTRKEKEESETMSVVKWDGECASGRA